MSLAEELGYDFSVEKCFEPIIILDKQSGELISRPCGKCLPCLRRRQSEWIVRLREHLANSFSAYFITLTYDDEFVPIVGGNDERENLDRRDPIAFWRRMRSLVQKGGFIWHDPNHVLPDQPVSLLRTHFSYYLTSEYGPHSHRPHFHAVVFNLDPDFWKVDLLVRKCWPYGFISIHSYDGNFLGFIGYTTKYLVNHMLCPEEGLTKPFSLMSKNLGLTYVDRMTDWHHSSLKRRYLPYDGKNDILPRYYRERIYNASERALQGKDIQVDLDRRARDLEKALGDDPDLLRRFNDERLKYQQDRMYDELQLMLKKQKIK